MISSFSFQFNWMKYIVSQKWFNLTIQRRDGLIVVFQIVKKNFLNNKKMIAMKIVWDGGELTLAWRLFGDM